MKKISLTLLFITTYLYAEPNDVKSKLVLESENFKLDHESAYGVTNSYAFFVAEHQIHADDCLVFYYGTKVGVVTEDYTAQNGFGPDAEKYSTVIKANLGVNYDLRDYQKLSLEGSRSQDDLHRQTESRLKFGYRYKF